jgi:hypothetical protein
MLAPPGDPIPPLGYPGFMLVCFLFSIGFGLLVLSVCCLSRMAAIMKLIKLKLHTLHSVLITSNLLKNIAFCMQCLEADDLADAVVYALSAPPHVQVYVFEYRL